MPFPAPRTRALARLGGYLDLNDEMDVPPVAPSESEGIRSVQETPPPPEQQAMQTPEPPNELETLKEQQRRAVFAADIGRAGAMAAEAISGAKAPMALYDRQEARAGEPLKEYMERLKINARATPRATATGGRPTLMTDEQAREAVRASYPNAPPSLIDNTTAGNFEQVMTDLRAKAGANERAGALTRREELEKARLGQQVSEGRLNRSVQWARLRQDAEQAGASIDFRRWLYEQEQDAKEKERAEKAETAAKEVAVSGFEVVEGATPTKTDAEKVKTTNEAAERLRGTIRDLRALRTKYGTAPKGTGADLQQQALRAVQLEAKNIVGLGALSGPDFGLMQDLSTQDVNSIPEWARRTFGGASVEESLEGMERWMNTVVTATATARGYRPKSSPGPARTPAANVLPKGADGKPTLETTGLPPPPPGKVRVRINGKVGLIPAANLAKAKAAGAEEVK